LTALALGGVTHVTILAGMPVLLVGAALHFWSKGCLRQNRVVSKSGPYRFLRHPFYLANALIDAGIAVMSGSWALRALLPLWWLAAYIPVIRREERYLKATFADYEEYAKQVPALIPWRRPLKTASGVSLGTSGGNPESRIFWSESGHEPEIAPSWSQSGRDPQSGFSLSQSGRDPQTGLSLGQSGRDPQTGFSWGNPNIAGGEEIPRLVRILAYPLLFLVTTDFRACGWAFLGDGLGLAALTLFGTMHALAWQIERHQRKRRRILPPWLSHPAARVAVALSILALAHVLPTPVTPLDGALAPAGAGLLALAILVFFTSPVGAMVAECLVLVGAVTACRLLWLAAIPLLLYAAWILDTLLQREGRNAASSEGDHEDAAGPPLRHREECIPAETR
jgi:hypothetical protein